MRRSRCRVVTSKHSGHGPCVSTLSKSDKSARPKSKTQRKKARKRQEGDDLRPSFRSAGLWLGSGDLYELHPTIRDLLGHEAKLTFNGKVWRWSIPTLRCFGTTRWILEARESAMRVLLSGLPPVQREALVQRLFTFLTKRTTSTARSRKR